MSYRLAGRSADFCSCNTPCPCAFGQEPTGGTCRSVICFDIQEGESDGIDLSGTRAVLISTFDGVWTGGNFTAALVLATAGRISFKAGDVAEGAGSTLKDVDGTAEIQVINAHYPLQVVTAGRSTKAKANAPGLQYDLDGSGFWTGPFEFEG